MSDFSIAAAASTARTLADDLAAASDPRLQLAAARTLQQWATHVRDVLAQRCVDAGESYATVGRLVGVTREAARQRYPRT